MFKRTKQAIPVILVFCVGCAVRRPLMVPDQAKLIEAQTKTLKPYAEVIQQAIKTSNLPSALVISAQDSSTPPYIYPTVDPVATALEHIDQARSASYCFLVYVRSLPITPQQVSCTLLTKQAEDFSLQQKAEERQNTRLSSLEPDVKRLESELETLKSSLEALTTKANGLSEQIAQQEAHLQGHDSSLSNDKKDISSLAKILAPTTKMVKFHEAQLESEEKTLDSLIEQYSQTTAAVGKNNQQIESMITDLNASFAQVKATLSQMQQKLSTVR